jgi:hypothetical protein
MSSREIPPTVRQRSELAVGGLAVLGLLVKFLSTLAVFIEKFSLGVGLSALVAVAAGIGKFRIAESSIGLARLLLYTAGAVAIVLGVYIAWKYPTKSS